MKNKITFTTHIPAELKKEIEERHREDGIPSQTAFVENAVRFYLQYLDCQRSSDFLSGAVKSCIEGKLSTFENRIAKLLYKQAVEIDMAMNIVSNCVELDEDYMRKVRANSISNIKRTNGQVSFEQIAREDTEC